MSDTKGPGPALRLEIGARPWDSRIFLGDHDISGRITRVVIEADAHQARTTVRLDFIVQAEDTITVESATADLTNAKDLARLQGKVGQS